MQEVYDDGGLGPLKDFDVEELEKSLRDPKVDHVDVFKKGSTHEDRLRQHRKIRKKLKKL